MNRKQITLTLAGLGIMAIAAVGCASDTVSANDEPNQNPAPVIGAPADPSGNQGIAVGEPYPGIPVEGELPKASDSATSTPSDDLVLEPVDEIDYPILDPGIGNGELPIAVESDGGIGDGALPLPVHPIELPPLPVNLPEVEEATTSPVQLPEYEGEPVEIPVQLPVIEEDEAAAPLLCMSTMAVQLPIEFHFGQDATPTGFDGINRASCMFPEEIEKITVILTGVDGGPSHVESWGLPEVSSSVSFPLPADWFSMATRAWLGAGEYNREMTATGVSGETYDLVAQAGALGTVTILAD